MAQVFKESLEKVAAGNPSVEQPKSAVRKNDYIPMGDDELQLAVPEIPGWVLFWPCDRPGRIARLMRQGWKFVAHDEVDVPNFKTIAGDVRDSGNKDLGDRISVYGYTDERGGEVNQYLMKIEKEKWEQLELAREQQSDRVVSALRGRQVGSEHEAPGDAVHRYNPVRSNTTIFDKKRR